MLKELLRNTKFRSKISGFYKENKKEILDIILFGSIVRGKEKPGDIDILIIYTEKENLDTNYKLQKLLQNEEFNVSVISKIYRSLFEINFKARESYLSEGYSLVLNKFISSGLGYDAMVLFKYELKKMSKSDRMRFYYALHGRDTKGILKTFNAIKFSDTIIFAPVENAEKIKEFFEYWKINYNQIPILIPSRIINAERLK